MLQDFPSGKQYPSIEDDRFWETALDLDMPVTVHVDIERTGKGPFLDYPRATPELLKELEAPGRSFPEQMARFSPIKGSGAMPAVQWTLSGLFDRFPQPQDTVRREPDRMDTVLPAERRHPLRAEPVLGGEPARLQAALPPAERIPAGAHALGLPVRPGGRAGAGPVERGQPHLGLRLPTPGVGLARLVEDPRRGVRGRARRGALQDDLRQRDRVLQARRKLGVRLPAGHACSTPVAIESAPPRTVQ